MFFGGITLLGSLSLSVTGQSGEVAVTVTTLVVALAFQPLRRRIQQVRSTAASPAARSTPRPPCAPSRLGCARRSTWTRSAASFLGVVEQTFRAPPHERVAQASGRRVASATQLHRVDDRQAGMARARSAAAIWIAQPGFAVATTSGAASSTASALRAAELARRRRLSRL